jgi:hypothetical protein
MKQTKAKMKENMASISLPEQVIQRKPVADFFQIFWQQLSLWYYLSQIN